MKTHTLVSPSLDERSAVFFPSIASTERKDHFLVAFRTWKLENSPVVKTPGKRGHPWYSLWMNALYDGVGFAIIKKTANGFMVKKVKQFSNAGKSKMDVRLFNISPTKYMVTYNTFRRLNASKFQSDYEAMSKTLRNKCFKTRDTSFDYMCVNQHKANLNISLNTLMPKFSKESLICAKHHQRIEKNVCPFLHRKKIYYHYSMTPWTVLDNLCNKITHSHSDLFLRIVNYYDPSPVSVYEKALQFSCSTPLVLWNNEYLGVGHFKVKKSHRMKGTLRKLMQKALKSNVVHYEYIYGMYLYTIHKHTLSLSRCSPAFIFYGAMSFPSGIVTSQDTIIVSYHENDINMKLCEFSSHEVDTLLKYSNRTKADDYEFKFQL